MTAPVLCFGNLQLDVLCRPVTALPRSGTFSMLDSIDFLISGNGGNVATVLSRLGLDVELAGYSGADITGEHIRTLLGRMGVGIDKLLRHPTARTGTSIITLSPDGERSGFFVNGANALFDLHSVPDAWLQQRQVVSVGSVFVLPQFTGEAIRQLFRRAHIYGATTVLNLCWDSERQGLGFLRGALAETDCCILNAVEGHRLTGHSQPEQILSAFTTLTAGYTIVTRGSDGCYLSTSTGVQHISTRPVKAIDSTGAGDSFVAGVIAGIVEKLSVSDCASLGNQVAAYAVTGPGAYPRMPTLAALKHSREY